VLCSGQLPLAAGSSPNVGQDEDHHHGEHTPSPAADDPAEISESQQAADAAAAADVAGLFSDEEADELEVWLCSSVLARLVPSTQ
jgi:hypothetical protein